MIEGMLVVPRHPMARPVRATMVTHKAADMTSATDRPTRMADRHMGRVRNRSITPSCRSVLNPTAVPMTDVVRFKVSRPARAKSL